jgi:hypothetical protein
VLAHTQAASSPAGRRGLDALRDATLLIMSKPYIHALSSAKRHGGSPEDYLDIHNLMDSSKAAIADNRHRCLTHNAWFIGTILERVFGVTRTNSAGKTYSVRDIGEEHVLEDFGGKFIPSAQDYIAEMAFADWMQNGKGNPPSYAKISEKHKKPKYQIQD